MIVFDLDGTLADCEHRKHFVDPEKNENFARWNGDDFRGFKGGEFQLDVKWKPNWNAFFEACDRDKQIKESIEILMNCLLSGRNVEIWSGRSESVREKTMNWLQQNLFSHHRFRICLVDDPQLRVKMRPIADFTPDDQLKEEWLDEVVSKGKKIDFVFDDRPKVIRMWRRRGIFVFNCCQHNEEF